MSTEEEEIQKVKTIEEADEELAPEDQDSSEKDEKTGKDQTEEDPLQAKIKEKKKKAAKKRNKRLIIIGSVLLFSYAVYWLFKPFKAPEEYAICRTFLELSITYPHTLRIAELKQSNGMQLWYTHTDAFGEHRMESFTCFFGQDENGNRTLEQLKLYKVNIDPDRLESYKSAMVYLNANPRMLNWPYEVPDSLANLHFDSDSFMNVQLRNIRKKIR